jgi:hypothetical protein
MHQPDGAGVGVRGLQDRIRLEPGEDVGGYGGRDPGPEGLRSPAARLPALIFISLPVRDVHRDFHSEAEISRLWCFPAHSLCSWFGRLDVINRYQCILLRTGAG